MVLPTIVQHGLQRSAASRRIWIWRSAGVIAAVPAAIGMTSLARATLNQNQACVGITATDPNRPQACTQQMCTAYAQQLTCSGGWYQSYNIIAIPYNTCLPYESYQCNDGYPNVVCAQINKYSDTSCMYASCPKVALYISSCGP